MLDIEGFRRKATLLIGGDDTRMRRRCTRRPGCIRQ